MDEYARDMRIAEAAVRSLELDPDNPTVREIAEGVISRNEGKLFGENIPDGEELKRLNRLRELLGHSKPSEPEKLPDNLVMED